MVRGQCLKGELSNNYSNIGLTCRETLPLKGQLHAISWYEFFHEIISMQMSKC